MGQRALERNNGVGQSSIALCLAGKRGISHAWLARIAKALG